MDFVSGVSSTYDFSVYAQRKTLSAEAREKKSAVSQAAEASASKTENDQKTDSVSLSDTSFKVNSSGKELTEEDQKALEKLKKRDVEVREHEQAHQRAGAGITGQPQYTYEAGPDGKQYAVGGSVPVDMSEEDTPEATINKAGLVRRVALAPKDPSRQDMKIAQEASRMETEARAELLAESQQAAQSYASVKNIPTSKSSASASAQGANTAASSIATSSDGTDSDSRSSSASTVTSAAANTVNPYAELSSKISGNTGEATSIKASNTRKLDLMSGKSVDLFG